MPRICEKTGLKISSPECQLYVQKSALTFVDEIALVYRSELRQLKSVQQMYDDFEKHLKNH